MRSEGLGLVEGVGEAEPAVVLPEEGPGVAGGREVAGGGGDGGDEAEQAVLRYGVRVRRGVFLLAHRVVVVVVVGVACSGSDGLVDVVF